MSINIYGMKRITGSLYLSLLKYLRAKIMILFPIITLTILCLGAFPVLFKSSYQVPSDIYPLYNRNNINLFKNSY